MAATQQSELESGLKQLAAGSTARLDQLTAHRVLDYLSRALPDWKEKYAAFSTLFAQTFSEDVPAPEQFLSGITPVLEREEDKAGQLRTFVRSLARNSVESKQELFLLPVISLFAGQRADTGLWGSQLDSLFSEQGALHKPLLELAADYAGQVSQQINSGLSSITSTFNRNATVIRHGIFDAGQRERLFSSFTGQPIGSISEYQASLKYLLGEGRGYLNELMQSVQERTSTKISELRSTAAGLEKRLQETTKVEQADIDKLRAELQAYATAVTANNALLKEYIPLNGRRVAKENLDATESERLEALQRQLTPFFSRYGTFPFKAKQRQLKEMNETYEARHKLDEELQQTMMSLEALPDKSAEFKGYLDGITVGLIAFSQHMELYLRTTAAWRGKNTKLNLLYDASIERADTLESRLRNYAGNSVAQGVPEDTMRSALAAPTLVGGRDSETPTIDLNREDSAKLRMAAEHLPIVAAAVGVESLQELVEQSPTAPHNPTPSNDAIETLPLSPAAQVFTPSSPEQGPLDEVVVTLHAPLEPATAPQAEPPADAAQAYPKFVPWPWYERAARGAVKTFTKIVNYVWEGVPDDPDKPSLQRTQVPDGSYGPDLPAHLRVRHGLADVLDGIRYRMQKFGGIKYYLQTPSDPIEARNRPMRYAAAAGITLLLVAGAVVLRGVRDGNKHEQRDRIAASASASVPSPQPTALDVLNTAQSPEAASVMPSATPKESVGYVPETMVVPSGSENPTAPYSAKMMPTPQQGIAPEPSAVPVPTMQSPPAAAQSATPAASSRLLPFTATAISPSAPTPAAAYSPAHAPMLQTAPPSAAAKPASRAYVPASVIQAKYPSSPSSIASVNIVQPADQQAVPTGEPARNIGTIVQAAAPSQDYTVKQGDTLSSILDAYLRQHGVHRTWKDFWGTDGKSGFVEFFRNYIGIEKPVDLPHGGKLTFASLDAAVTDAMSAAEKIAAVKAAMEQNAGKGLIKPAVQQLPDSYTPKHDYFTSHMAQDVFRTLDVHKIGAKRVGAYEFWILGEYLSKMNGYENPARIPDHGAVIKTAVVKEMITKYNGDAAAALETMLKEGEKIVDERLKKQAAEKPEATKGAELYNEINETYVPHVMAAAVHVPLTIYDTGFDNMYNALETIESVQQCNDVLAAQKGYTNPVVQQWKQDRHKPAFAGVSFDEYMVLNAVAKQADTLQAYPKPGVSPAIQLLASKDVHTLEQAEFGGLDEMLRVA